MQPWSVFLLVLKARRKDRSDFGSVLTGWAGSTLSKDSVYRQVGQAASQAQKGQGRRQGPNTLQQQPLKSLAWRLAECEESS